MSSQRSFAFLPFALLAAVTVAGCGNEKPKPDPSAAASASNSTNGVPARLNIRNPLAPTMRVDPVSTKDYRIDVCYFGTLTLRQARDAYMGSLGGAEPSEKKVPNFGGIVTPPAASAAPATSGAPSAKPSTTGAPSAKPSAAPSASAKAATPAGTAGPGMQSPIAPQGVEPPHRPFDIALRAPHERNARACSVAAGLKDAPMGDLDAALQNYAQYSVELAKTIATATMYYQREEYKKDSFAKGKELHKQLTEAFAKLDENQDKLGAAIDAWRKAHPPDVSKQDEAEKLGTAAFNDARDLMLAVFPKKPNVAGFKDATGRLEKSLGALKTFANTNTTDPWGKMMAPSLESMLKAAKDAEPKLTEKGIDGDTLLVLTNTFVSVIESRYRALSRSLTMKAQPPAAVPAASGAPSGGAAEPPKPE